MVDNKYVKKAEKELEYLSGDEETRRLAELREKAIRDELAEKLHAIGLRSNDLHPANIGILTSENRIHFDSINFDIGNEISTSIQNNNSLRIKGAGEAVIIDLDCLEIEDITKYSDYLRKIGFSLENNVTTKTK